MPPLLIFTPVLKIFSQTVAHFRRRGGSPFQDTVRVILDMPLRIITVCQQCHFPSSILPIQSRAVVEVRDFHVDEAHPSSHALVEPCSPTQPILADGLIEPLSKEMVIKLAARRPEQRGVSGARGQPIVEAKSLDDIAMRRPRESRLGPNPLLGGALHAPHRHGRWRVLLHFPRRAKHVDRAKHLHEGKGIKFRVGLGHPIGIVEQAIRVDPGDAIHLGWQISRGVPPRAISNPVG